jgi:hypothetical protein
MVTQITLNTKPHGFDSYHGKVTEKVMIHHCILAHESLPARNGSLLSRDKRYRIVVGYDDKTSPKACA